MAAFGRLVPGAWPGWHSAKAGDGQRCPTLAFCKKVGVGGAPVVHRWLVWVHRLDSAESVISGVKTTGNRISMTNADMDKDGASIKAFRPSSFATAPSALCSVYGGIDGNAWAHRHVVRFDSNTHRDISHSLVQTSARSLACTGR